MARVQSNIHTHSRYSDGANTLEELVWAALDKGFVSLGFSEHAWAPYDGDVCIKKEDVPLYLAEAARLKAEYAGRIELYVGFEVDCYEHTPKAGLDFTIGSVHYLYDAAADAYYTIDYQPEQFEKARDRIAGGDVRELLRLYYGEVIRLTEEYRPDIVGHLDLITKLNGRHHYFDETSAWYRALVEDTARRLAAAGVIVEVNTGGIARGYKTEPYPSREFLALFRELGVPVLLSSDAHAAANLDFWFDESAALLREVGYRSAKRLEGGRFVDVEL